MLSGYQINKLKECLQVEDTNHEEKILEEKSLIQANSYCVINSISPQKYGLLLEKYIREKHSHIKNKAADCKGDSFKEGKNFEIKVSIKIGDKKGRFNFVQIRPSQNCDYILTAYNLSIENYIYGGELYIFRITNNEIKNIIVMFGQYAHRTKKECGEITLDKINDPKDIKEYAIRPNINCKCWNELLKFRINENEL